jgi:hypothetical protein
MAVVNEMDDKVSFPQDPLFGGAAIKQIMKKVTVGATDNDTSKYLIGDIPGEAKITNCAVMNTAITGGTDYDIGLFSEDGTVYDADAIVDGASMASARTSMTNLALAGAGSGIANMEKTVAELLSHVNKPVPASGEVLAKRVYRVGLTANTIGSTGGTVLVLITYRDSA